MILPLQQGTLQCRQVYHSMKFSAKYNAAVECTVAPPRVQWFDLMSARSASALQTSVSISKRAVRDVRLHGEAGW